MRIENFTHAYGLDVKAMHPHDAVPALVCLINHAAFSPCSFQHAMTPDQARQMAAALLAAADEVEGVQE